MTPPRTDSRKRSEQAARVHIRRALLASALIRTVRAVRAADDEGRPVPLHQAVRLYRRHRSDLDPAWTPTPDDDGTRYLHTYYHARSAQRTAARS